MAKDGMTIEERISHLDSLASAIDLGLEEGTVEGELLDLLKDGGLQDLMDYLATVQVYAMRSFQGSIWLRTHPAYGLYLRQKQNLRCNRITAHFFNHEPSETCWWCRIHFPPRRKDRLP